MLNNYTAETLKAVRDILIQSAKFSRAYWWSPQPNANSRRELERYESRPTIEWDESGHHYTASFDVVCHYSYTKDGKRTNATAIRNSANRMERDLKAAERESDLCEDF